MTVSKIPTDGAIHIGCTETIIERLSDDTLGGGGRVFTLCVSDVRSADDLVSTAIQSFDIPWRVVGLNSVLSVGSELYWIDGTRSFLTVVRGCDDIDTALRKEVVWLLINIIDRMRGAGDHYTVAFPASELTEELRTLLDGENFDLAEVARVDPQSDTHPVPIVDHRTDPPTVR